MIEAAVRDLKRALRSLSRSPGYSLAAIAMLALGIGINAAVFTLTNAVLFKGFPLVENNDRIVYLSSMRQCCVSYPDFQDWRNQARSFTGMAVVQGFGAIIIDDHGFPYRHDVTQVSANTFQLIGQRPVIGRDFTPADEDLGSGRVAILSYAFWEGRYARDPGIIGRSLRLNGLPTTIVGVMPQGFLFPQKQDLWVPLVRDAQTQKREARDLWFAFGRLADGVTVDRAKSEMRMIGQRLAAAYPATNRESFPIVQTFSDFFIGTNATKMYGLMWGAVGFVLLIVCANLANLTLARAMSKSREFSLHLALGAGRWDIVRRLLAESLVLSTIGGLLAWWIAKAGTRSYAFVMTRKSPWMVLDYEMDFPVLAYLMVVSAMTGVLFGLLPALRLSRSDVNSTLKDGARGVTVGRSKRVPAMLLAIEMGLAVVLLAGAGAMIQSFLNVRNADVGINTNNLLIANVELPSARFPKPEDRISFFDRLKARLQALPGVESSASGQQLPTLGTGRATFEVFGAPPVDEKLRPKSGVMVVEQDYFHCLGVKILGGRAFAETDAAEAPAVTVVNQRFAAAQWPAEDPIGKKIRLFDKQGPGSWLTVVGTVSNIIQNDATRQEFQPVIYLPYRQKAVESMWILVRTAVRPTSIANALRAEIQTLDAELPIFGPFSLTDRLEVYSNNRFYGSLFMFFAAVALLLACIGLYSIVADSVNQRTQEIGVRIALGATPSYIAVLVLKQVIASLGVGLVAGLAGSIAVNRMLRAELVQVSPVDPVTITMIVAALITFAVFGCVIPLGRAIKVDPVIALRYQ